MKLANGLGGFVKQMGGGDLSNSFVTEREKEKPTTAEAKHRKRRKRKKKITTVSRRRNR